MESPRKKYISLPKPFKKVWHFAILTASVFALLPGMFVGQILSYSIIWPTRKHLWKMPHPTRGSFDRQWWETALSLLSFLSHFAFAPSLPASLGFLIGCNIAYAICILPDHDSFESAVENHIEANSTSLPDWGEIQVRHSSDFGKGVWGRLFGEVAGGINFQIVHHLFPGVSHVHFPMLTKVVEETCAEYNVPFVRHDSLAAALWSVAKTFSLTMAPVKSVESPSPSPVITPNTESLSKRILSEDTIAKVKKDRMMARRQRGMDAVTGLLFGAWLALCTIAIFQRGRHLLLVPSTLASCLFAHWMMGSFSKCPHGKRCAVTDALENRAYRFENLRSSAAALASSVAILAVDNLAQLDVFSVSSESIILMATGMVGAELFAVVLSGTFALCPRRVFSDTIKLVLFTVASYWTPNPMTSVPLLLLGVEHFVSLLMNASIVARLSSLALQTVAMYWMFPAWSMGALLIAANAGLLLL